MVTLAEIQAAHARIAPYIVRTPLLRIPAMDEPLGCEVYLKFEGLQVMGAFKIRGAMNKALTLTPEQLQRGLVCASSGNHAQGVAYAAKALGTKASIVMPEDANPVKLAGVRAFGGSIEQVGTLSSQREQRANELAAQRGMCCIHPYADTAVIAGQGTIGLEILEDLPAVSAVVTPVGGGGLICGVSTAIKGLSPQVKTIGVEPLGAARYGKSRAAGMPIVLNSVDTIADGTRGDKANPNNFEMIQDKVDSLCTVDDGAILTAMSLLLHKGKLAVEPSGAMPVAAALGGVLGVEQTDKVVFVLSGGNVDPALLAKVAQ